MQNQIHELAKTLPPPRKQNTACDACRSARFLSFWFELVVQLFCRSRKVKCHRLPGHDKVSFTSCLTSHLLTAFLATVSGTFLFRYLCLPFLTITTALFIKKLPLHVRLCRASCCCNPLTHLPGILFSKLQAKRSAALMLIGDLEILVLGV
jgi:hypothetical protein